MSWFLVTDCYILCGSILLEDGDKSSKGAVIHSVQRR